MLDTPVHPSWSPFISEKLPVIAGIYDIIASAPYNPSPENVLRFARADLSRVRVVILGQDPYPQPGAATGRSFEVAGLSDWTRPFPQASLRNIVRAIYAAKTGEELKWSELRGKIARGEFAIRPPDRLWDALERQGVLFLNAYLTCAAGQPLSHKALWEAFSADMVRYIDKSTAPCWFLWGAGARSFAPLITCGRIYASRHPMMTTSAQDDFMRNPCFRETGGMIDWTGGSV